MEKSHYSLWSPRFVCSAVAALVVFYLCLYAVIRAGGGNVKAYVCAVVLCALFFLAAFVFLGKTALAAGPALFDTTPPRQKSWSSFCRS